MPRNKNKRRCGATRSDGKRCRNWVLRNSPADQHLCSIHSGRSRRPQPHERCEAATRSGEPCTHWPVRGSEQQYGARLCTVHLPDGDPRKAYGRLPGPGERRCRAITVDGVRCSHWAMHDEAAGGLCRIHAFPDALPNITHGFFRAVPHFSPAIQAMIVRLAEEGPPAAAEVLLTRLKTRGVFAYFSEHELPPEEQDRVALLLFRGVNAVSRLLRARKTLSKIDWRPYSVGGTGKMLDAMRRNAERPDSFPKTRLGR